jgi:peroxiredoxin
MKISTIKVNRTFISYKIVFFNSFIIFTCVLSASGCFSTPKANSSTSSANYLGAGDTFPVTSITTIQAEVVELDNPNKKKLIILFATWCHDSNRLFKAFEKTNILSDPNIEVIAISKMESDAVVKAWRQKKNIKTPLALDKNGKIYHQFGSTGLPRIVTIGNNNKIISAQLADHPNPKNQLAKIIWTL